MVEGADLAIFTGIWTHASIRHYSTHAKQWSIESVDDQIIARDASDAAPIP
jgi:hypothetical protein